MTSDMNAVLMFIMLVWLLYAYIIASIVLQK